MDNRNKRTPDSSVSRGNIFEGVLSRDTLEVELPQEPETRHVHALHVLDGGRAGLIFILDGDEVIIGRSDSCQLPLSDPGVSRAHAVFTCKAGAVMLADLGSRNGTFVNGSSISKPVALGHGDAIRIGSIQLRYGYEAEAQVRRLRDLHEAAVRDHLTRLYNRRFLEERLLAEVAYAVRHHAPLSLLMFDIDHFKQLNDAYGHQAGDVALRAVAAVLQGGVRTEDLVARYGGEEFVIIARGAGLLGAVALAERLRDRVRALVIPNEGRVMSVTVSGGAAALSDTIRSPGTLLRAADQALFHAKEQGRDRIVAAPAEQLNERTSEMEAVGDGSQDGGTCT